MKMPAPLRGAIVAMNRDRVIGLDGRLPWHYSADLRRFKRRTMGCAIVMGRKTWESIGSTALPGRRNIVISRQGVSGVECHGSIGEGLDACGDADAWIIGGGQIYEAAIPFLNLLDVTWVPDRVDTPGAVRFPPIDLRLWSMSTEEPLDGDPELLNTVYLRRRDA